ncbi:hypothetical protein Tco_0125384, partial [Tanacetum coccineum]
GLFSCRLFMVNIGSIDLDALKSRMSQLKGNESGNAHSMNSSDATRVNLVESGVTRDGNPKVSNSSPLVSPSTTINVPRELYNIDVAATFRVWYVLNYTYHFPF